MNNLTLSKLRKTWFIDIDGTLLKHNSDLENNQDYVIQKSKDFLSRINDDFIILTTSRSEKYKIKTESFLKENNIKYNQIIYNLPYGERILLNDKKNSGLLTAYSLNLTRNEGIELSLNLTDI
jgi:FMN phosphatase YigB (HAD superfamily)